MGEPVYMWSLEQSTQAWFEARAGIPTASECKRIVTPSGKLSSQREQYKGELLAAWALGVDIGEVYTEAMERGKVLEPSAFKYYSFHRDSDPQKCGLIYRDSSRMSAASPDALVGDDGGLEIKIPSAGRHLVWLSRGICPSEHLPQVQMCLWVSGRRWWDFMSYHPELPPLIVRVGPDEGYQQALGKWIPLFIDELIEGRANLEALGVRDALQRWEGG